MANRGPRGGGYNQRGDNSVVDGIVASIKKLNHLVDLTVDDLVKHAESLGKYLSQNNLKTNQIRKFLDAVKKVESDGGKGFSRDEVKLLKPKLAYAAGRQSEVKPLMQVLDPCIDRVDTKEDFKRFARLVESIVAYHKFYGGRD